MDSLMLTCRKAPCRDSNAVGVLLTTAGEPAWKNVKTLLFGVFAISILCAGRKLATPLHEQTSVQ